MGPPVLTIGDFSKVTGLTVKTLRFYHEEGVLAPARVDPETGYRYYDARQREKACMIAALRGLEFSLDDIKAILGDFHEDSDILDHLEKHRRQIQEKLRLYRDVATQLDQMIQREREARMSLQNATFEVEEKTLPPLLIAGVRMRGRYEDCGKGFAKIGKALWRQISGKCFMLHYDKEYKEDDADFEACMPIKSAKEAEGISVRELPGGRCVSLVHQGPYDELSRSYAKLLAYVDGKRYEIVMPTREVYLKGPGMIFKGNPKKYLTEIQMVIK